MLRIDTFIAEQPWDVNPVEVCIYNEGGMTRRRFKGLIDTITWFAFRCPGHCCWAEFGKYVIYCDIHFDEETYCWINIFMQGETIPFYTREFTIPN